MAIFPKLKTSAVAQYPATKTVRYQNQVLRFLDGSEQRYRDASSALHRWVIQLYSLDESELASIEQFFAANQGRFASFAFTDPWDGTLYANCSIEADAVDLTASGELRCATAVTITESRN